MMRKLYRSIPGRLVGLYLALTVASLATITTLVYRTTHEILLASAKEQLRTVATGKSEIIKRWMTEREHDVGVLAKSEAVQEHAYVLAGHSAGDVESRRRAVSGLLRLVRDQYGAYREIKLVSADEHVLASSLGGADDARRVAPRMGPAIRDGQPVVSLAYRRPGSDALSLDIAAPIAAANGQLLGAVVATVDLDGVNELTDTSQLMAAGRAYLVDSRGVVIAHPDRKRLFRDDLAGLEGPRAVVSGQSGVVEYVDAHGVEIIGAYRWLPRWRWGLVAEISRDDALAPVRNARQSLVIISSLVTIAVLLGTLLMVRSIVGPLRELTRGVQAVAMGQLDQRLDIAGGDEVAYLTRCFNEMATNLAESRTAMAERIHEATLRLERKNAELAAANEELHVANRELEQQRALVERSARFAAMGEMAAGLAHEINNPLTTMKNLVHSLRPTVPDEDIRGRDLAVVAEEIEKLNRLVVNFLKYARPPEPDIRPVDVADIVQSTIKLLEPQANQKQLTIVSSVDAELPQALADREQLGQVLVNLMINAIQASPEGAEVMVSAIGEGAEQDGAPTAVQIAVGDQGPGVSEESRAKVFNPFFTTKADGSGLGLAISQRIVEEHGGTLTLSSVFGRGATFVVTLSRLQGTSDEPNSDRR